jgi:hypothetical protein
VKVTGSKNGWLEVVVNDSLRGFVPASRLDVGQETPKPGAPAHTHGAMGAMDGMSGCCEKDGCCEKECCR